MFLLEPIEQRYPEILKKVADFRRSKKTSSPDVYDMDFYHARTENPWYGYIEIQNDGANSFFMLNNNDDVIAEFFLWYGANGYERTTIREWIRLVKSANCFRHWCQYRGNFLCFPVFPETELRKSSR